MKHPTMLLSTLILFLCVSLHAQKYTYSDKDEVFLGINFDEISKTKAQLLGFDNLHGAYITSVIENTAAEKAGLQPFDYLYAIGEYALDDENDLGDVLDRFKAGDETKLHLVRAGKNKSLPVELGRRSDARYSNNNRTEKPFLGVSSHSNYDKNTMGVKVEVSQNSTAAEMGLKDGDVIMAINGYKMVDWSDISTAINTMEVGQKIVVEYEREGKPNKATLPIKSYADSKRSTVVKYNENGYAFLGINSSSISEEKAKKLGFDNPYGSYVTSVIGNTAAKKAGLQPFDYIYGIDEYRTGESQKLTSILRKYQPGEQAKLQLIRKGKKISVPVAFGQRSDATLKDADPCEEAFLGIQNMNNATGEEGVQVSIVDNSTAKALKMQDRDIIRSINGYTILDWQDVKTAINNMKAGESIEVAFSRNGDQQTVKGAIKSYCDTKPSKAEYSDRWEKNDGGYSNDNSWDGGETIDLSSVAVEIQDISNDEASAIQTEHGYEIPLSNNLNIERLQVTPNPDAGMFRLQFNLPGSGPTAVRLYNSMGRMIYEYDLGQFSGEFSDEVDISQNGAGSYFMEVRQGNQTVAKKILLK